MAGNDAVIWLFIIRIERCDVSLKQDFIYFNRGE